jgi:RHS repeat-associated protein
MKRRTTNKARGNRAKVTRGVGGGVTIPAEFGNGSDTSHGYDLTSQLTSEKYYSPTPELFREHGYEYDLAGNRLKKTSVVDNEEEVENTSYDVANQILKRIRSGAFGSETTLFEHDANGNLTQETIQGTPDIVKNLAYNFENNMTSFQRVEAATETNLFRYSADGLRVEKTAPDQELSKFLLDGVAVALQRASTVAENLKSFSFDGSTTINYGSCPNFTSTGGLAVSAWVDDVNEAAGYLTGFLLLGGTNIGADSNFGGLFVDIAGVVSFFSSQSIASGKHHIYLRYDGSGSFADPHMELYLDGEKVTLTPNTGGTTPNFSGDLKAGMAQSNYDGKLDQLAIWDTDKGAGDFLAALYNEGEGRIIESDEEDLILLALFNENYDDSTGTFTSPSLSGTETYDDPLVTDARGPLEPKMRFIPGLAMIDAEGDVSYYLEDALGSVMALADADENIVGVYQYDAWGNALVEPENDVNPYRWCGAWGYYFDKNTEMYLLGSRWYDAKLGRFITEDVIGFEGGDANLYRYMGNDPINSIDPFGTWSWRGFFKGVGKAIVGVAVGVVVGAVVAFTAPAWLAVGLAVAGAAVGGYLVGQTLYEATSGREWSTSGTGRILCDEEYSERVGQGVVDVATMGMASSKWMKLGASRDKAWRHLSPRNRWRDSVGNVTTSKGTHATHAGLPPHQRPPTEILKNWDPTQYRGTMPTGADPALRAVVPYAILGSGVAGRCPCD